MIVLIICSRRTTTCPAASAGIALNAMAVTICSGRYSHGRRQRRTSRAIGREGIDAFSGLIGGVGGDRLRLGSDCSGALSKIIVGGTAATTASSIWLSCTSAPVCFNARRMPRGIGEDIALRIWFAAIGQFGPVTGRRFDSYRGVAERGTANGNTVPAAEPIEQCLLQAVPHLGVRPIRASAASRS